MKTAAIAAIMVLAIFVGCETQTADIAPTPAAGIQEVAQEEAPAADVEADFAEEFQDEDDFIEIGEMI